MSDGGDHYKPSTNLSRPLSHSLSCSLSHHLSRSLSHRCQVVGTLKPSINLSHSLSHRCQVVGTLKPSWWFVRVTLLVDWLFLRQNFGPMVGTYEGPFCSSVNVYGMVVLFAGGGDTSPV